MNVKFQETEPKTGQDDDASKMDINSHKEIKRIAFGKGSRRDITDIQGIHDEVPNRLSLFLSFYPHFINSHFDVHNQRKCPLHDLCDLGHLLLEI